MLSVILQAIVSQTLVLIIESLIPNRDLERAVCDPADLHLRVSAEEEQEGKAGV